MQRWKEEAQSKGIQESQAHGKAAQEKEPQEAAQKKASQEAAWEKGPQETAQENAPQETMQKKEPQEAVQEKEPQEEAQDQELIKDTGQLELKSKRADIQLLTIIGEIEGHECSPASSKTTKYEHLLPKLAEIEESSRIQGVLLLINTIGGDISAGLALAEMIASLSKPTVSLVLGDSHSIGVPLAVSADYSFIVPTGTMIIHPVRMNGLIIGAPQTYDYFRLMQERILGFIAGHSRARKARLEEMMMNTGMLTKDLGTILVGEEAVREGLIDEVGGIHEAMEKLFQMAGR